MPESWLYAVGGILIGMLVFVIGYQLVSSSINQLHTQNFISDFTDFHSDLESVCLQETGTSITVNLRVPYNVRVIYATNNTDDSPLTVVGKIENRELSSGHNLCFQFKTEQDLRCDELICNVTIPYMGALETYNDIELLMNKILGRPLTKTYELKITKRLEGVKVDSASCRSEGESCSHDSPCCSDADYCWSDTQDNYTCQRICAPYGNYSLSSYSCCSKNRDSLTGRCVQSATTSPSGPPPATPSEFNILFVQLNGPISDFETKAEASKDAWVSLTPLSACPEKVNAIVATDICSVPDQSGICSSDASSVAAETVLRLSECAEGYDYTRVVGIVPGDHVCEVAGGYTEGYAYRYYDFAISSEGAMEYTPTHEMGHTFGLCDEGYGSYEWPKSECLSGYCAGGGMTCAVQSECESDVCCPNYPEYDSIMCSDPTPCSRPCSYAEQFGPESSYPHLEGELDRYCEG